MAMTKKRIAIVSTGGTIEKTYDELQGVLSNRVSVLDVMLAGLELNGVELFRVALMAKDSNDMTAADHTLIAETVQTLSRSYDGVVVVHGTDRLSETGEEIKEIVGEPKAPIILTGAMRPYELRHTDAVQNLTEALLAVQLVHPGVYVSMHNRLIEFPGVVKDRMRGTFVHRDDA